MPDYRKMAEDLFLAPARGWLSQAPKAPPSMGLLGDIHNAIDPVNVFSGYGGLLAMALPPGATAPKLSGMRAPKKLYRGIVEGYQGDGSSGLGTFHLGKGLYSSRSKDFAKMYATKGKVQTLTPDEAWPSNPLVLRGQGGAQGLFLDYVFRTTKFKNAREFNKAYPDPADFVRERGFDGVVVGDEVVRYPKK